MFYGLSEYVSESRNKEVWSRVVIAIEQNKNSFENRKQKLLPTASTTYNKKKH